ncbi:MAG: lipoyl synthase [Armatimonadota bacterium]
MIRDTGGTGQGRVSGPARAASSARRTCGRLPLPEWLRVKAPKKARLAATKAALDHYDINTVCENARCPNIGECYGRRTATFMILGDRCTRNCAFCAVHSASPDPLDHSEPGRVAAAAADLGLAHVVITSVTRDDLPDGGAAHFARVIRAVRRRVPDATIEVLTPDFEGNLDAIALVCDAEPDVYNHNVETVPRLYPVVRPQADFERSLSLLRLVKTYRPPVPTKSGMMLGLGEERSEVVDVLKRLREVGCEMLTIGQYLQPSPRHLPVVRYVPPEEFADLGEEARTMGFTYVASAPLVRSSYRAEDALQPASDVPTPR